MSKPISNDPNACTRDDHWLRSRGKGVYCHQCGKLLDKGEWGPLYDAQPQPTTPADNLEDMIKTLTRKQYLTIDVFVNRGGSTTFIASTGNNSTHRGSLVEALEDLLKEVASDG